MIIQSNVRVRSSLFAGISTLALIAGGSAMAQNTPSTRQTAAAPEEIIVTARKREESIMKAPVILQAISSKQIEDLHITNIDALSSATPGLEINFGFVFSGIVINMRGLGNGGGANFVDQSTALNIDGAGLTHGAFYRTGLFDIGQVEVLKGPQSLFFGKSTSAGLIAIHSADPTTTWDSKVSVGYEFNNDELDLNGYISGPITDKLGIRVAGYHNTSKGYGTNPSNAPSPYHRLPAETNDGARLTLKYDDPDAGLRIKLKAATTHDYMQAWYGDIEQIRCSGPIAQAPLYAPYDDCKVNTVYAGAPGPKPYNPAITFDAFDTNAFANYGPSFLYRDGKPYSYTNATTALLNVDYDITHGLTLTSVSSLGVVKAADSGRESVAGVSGPIDIAGRDLASEYSQELRLTSNWKDSWINFMLGGLYTSGTRKVLLNLSIPEAGTIPGLGQFGLYTDDTAKLTSKNSSVFGQVILTPIDKWELSAGLRYTHIKKFFTKLIAFNNYPAFFVPGPSGDTTQNVPAANRRLTENATTPEVTLSYHPTDEITTFVSYKQGYKGPGFNASLTATTYTGTVVNGFNGEKVKGFEGGIKGRFLDNQLAVTATGYTFKYTGLQVNFTDLSTNSITTANGADARVQGIELGADYAPQSLRGLTLSAFINYNDSHYTRFPFAPCYGGQTAATGCIATATNVGQNLAGRALHVAPKVTGSLGASYQTELTDNYVGSADVHLKYSSSYRVTPELHPGDIGLQKGYAMLDLGLHFGRSDDTWELALLCQNCTDKIYVTTGIDGGSASGGVSDVVILTNRPRQITLQFSVHPDKL